MTNSQMTPPHEFPRWHFASPHYARLIRDVYPFPRGCPDKPSYPLFAPQWRTSTVMSLANQAWHDRNFSILPILADALQDAGCDREDVLDHLRSDTPHCRGCWALVDLVNEAPSNTNPAWIDNAAGDRLRLVTRSGQPGFYYAIWSEGLHEPGTVEAEISLYLSASQLNQLFPGWQQLESLSSPPNEEDFVVGGEFAREDYL